VVLFTLLAGAGLTGILLSVGFARAAKHKTQREARKRADLIRQRLAEEPQVERRTVEIRLGRSAGR
jgi:hypothetical protein